MAAFVKNRSVYSTYTVRLIVAALFLLLMPVAAQAAPPAITGGSPDENTLILTGVNLDQGIYLKVAQASPLKTLRYYRPGCSCGLNPETTTVNWNGSSITIIDPRLGDTYVKNVLVVGHVEGNSGRTSASNYKFTPYMLITGGEAPPVDPPPDPPENPFSLLALGRSACGVKDAAAYCWGDNVSWQLGIGDLPGTATPTPVVANPGDLAGKTVTAIVTSNNSAIFWHSCAIASGEAYCWGGNGSGQLGTGDVAHSSEPVAVYTGGELNGKTITDITVGADHTCVIGDGEVYCWGYNLHGQLGRGDTPSNPETHPERVQGLLTGKTVTDISSGQVHATCAIADGDVYCWGHEFMEMVEHNTPVAFGAAELAGKTATNIELATKHACVVADGDVYCWGTNEEGEVGNGTTDPALAPVLVGGALAGETVTQVALGGSSFSPSEHSCALTTTGKVYCWGADDFGQLGNGPAAASSVPVLVGGALTGKTVISIAAAVGITCAMDTAQDVYCWGDSSGRFGDNNAVSSSDAPVLVAFW